MPGMLALGARQMATESERASTEVSQFRMPAGAVFLSYASEDAAAAERIASALRAAGIEVWIDKSELRGGDAWDQSIRKQIKACALFIPIISRHAHDRIEGYFRLEWKLAVDRSHLIAPDQAFLLPVAIDDTPQSDERIPDRFRELQWTCLPDGEASPAFIERVRLLLLHEASSTSRASVQVSLTSTAHPSGGSVTPIWRPKAGLWVIGAALAVALAYFLADRFWLSSRSASSTASTTAPREPTSAAVPEKSIAVLPFVDLSEKHDQEYFADGMAEEILNLLVKIPDLKVIGHTSSFQFKGKTDDLRRIGATLGATYVVEGSVRRSGEHIRVTAQLIDTRNGAHRWSETYDRETSDVLKVQDEIAVSLVRALQLEVTPSLNSQSRSQARSAEAYDAYLRGLHALERNDEQGFNEADAHFHRALEIDPGFAPAAEGVAWALSDLAFDEMVPPRLGFEQARTAANAALKLDPNMAATHALLGTIHLLYDWDWPAARSECQMAVALAPSNAAALICVAQERMAVGDWAASLRSIDAAMTADPLLVDNYLFRLYACVRLNRLAEAESAGRRVLEISPTYAWGHYFLGMALLMEGRAEAALTEIQKEQLIEARDAGSVVAYEALRRPRDAEAALARLKTDNTGRWPFGLAIAYAALNRSEQAFEALDLAYTTRDASLWAIKGHPYLRPLERDSRYKAFLRKMNLPE
jgi:adenylate cyclase